MTWFLDMKISKKLLILTMISSLLIGFVGLVGYHYTKVGNNHFREVYEDHMVMLDIAQDMRQQNRTRQGTLLKLIVSDKGEQGKIIEQLHTRDTTFESLIAKLEKKDLNEKEKQLVDKIKSSSYKFLGLQNEIITLVASGKAQEALLQYKNAEAIPEELADRIRDLVKAQEEEAEIVYKKNQEDFKTTILVLLGVITGSIVLSFILGQYLSRLISKPLENIVREVSLIASGDLSSKDMLSNGNDEVGKLTTEFNRMKSSVRHLIKNVAQAAEQLASSSEELTASAEQSAQAANQVAETITEVAQGAEHQLQSVNHASGTVEQMSANIKQVVSNNAVVGDTSQKTATAAQEGLGALETAVNQMASIERTVNNSALVVTKLGERSKEIGQIVDTISGIAGQTNLLALNAAIEAARAGEQGRGFAVVAEEVRKLAEQSQVAAKQIADLIRNIQADTDEAVVAMSEGTNEVKVGTNVVNTAGQSFRQIAALIEKLSAQGQEIAVSVQQLGMGSQQLVSAMTEINSISRNTAGQTQTVSAATEEQSASMEEIAASSQSLAKMAEELQHNINKFKV